MGAGVVPIATLEDGSHRLLLGRERFMPSWKGSCRWSGFEGSRKDNESMDEAAVREFVEESLGVVPVAGGDALCAVHEREYWIRIVLKILNERKAERYHTTFVLPVMYDENIARKFIQLRMSLEHIDRAAQEWRYARPAVLGGEDMDVGAVEMIQGDDESETYVRVRRIPRHPSQPHLVAAPWSTDVFNEEGVQLAILKGGIARGVLEWDRLRKRVERTLVDHPSVSVQRCERWGTLQNVTISKDHLEKDQVRWWSIPELRKVLEGRGQIGTDRFRPYFLPVLQTLLHELSLDPPSVSEGPFDADSRSAP